MYKLHLIFTVLLLLSFIVSGCSPAAPIETAAPTAVPTANPTAIPTAVPTSIPSQTATSLPTPTATLALSAGDTQVSEIDGMTMVYAPAGDFSMGSLGITPAEQPVHTVYLDSYWIDRTEVTNGMYYLCVDAGECRLPHEVGSNTHQYYYFDQPLYANYPVIFVTWSEAQTYCDWAGRRLPTEAEWEKAARGTDRRKYPWGNTSPNDNLLNFNKPLGGDTTSVGFYPAGASPYGALDIAGNVTEWTADWYDAMYYSRSPASNPTGAATGQYKVVRGGSFYSDEAYVLSAFRHWVEPEKWDVLIGFRCALPAP
jgi:formylglycine-generating enzyme required for sulfatase activity